MNQLILVIDAEPVIEKGLRIQAQFVPRVADEYILTDAEYAVFRSLVTTGNNVKDYRYVTHVSVSRFPSDSPKKPQTEVIKLVLSRYKPNR